MCCVCVLQLDVFFYIFAQQRWWRERSRLNYCVYCFVVESKLLSILLTLFSIHASQRTTHNTYLSNEHLYVSPSSSSSSPLLLFVYVYAVHFNVWVCMSSIFMLFTSYIERTHSADGSSNTLMILRNVKRNLLHKQHLTRFVDYGQCICAHMWSQIVNVICGKCAVRYIWDILRNYSSGKREPLKCDQCVGVTTSTEKYFWINFHATYGLFHTFRSFWSKLSTLTEKLSLENILRIEN